MREIDRIIELSNLFGPSGFEDDVAAFVMEELSEFSPVTDHMRNVRCVYGTDEKKPKVMLDAHMDEVGIIVQAVKPNGTMRFLPIGGWAVSSFPTSAFLLRNHDNDFIRGIVAQKPPHFMSAAERNAPLQIEDLVVDCGYSSAEEAAANGFGPGVPAAPDVHCVFEARRNLFYGKAFDDRIGVAAEIETMKRINGMDLPCNVQAGFSVQEEVGERGVRANAIAFRPDVMICFEGCPADDTFSEPYMVQSAMGKGPMLRHMDVSMITNWRFQKLALDIAKEAGIPIQVSVRKGGGTNGAAVNELLGVPAIVIGVPVRYIHSSNCMCMLQDYTAAVELAVELLKRLDQETIDTL